MALAIPSLTITDNGNGTGAVATIAGSTAGTTNTVYAADWPGASFASKGSRVGDGVAAVALAPGPHWVYALSTSGSESVVSAVVACRTTNGALSILERCLAAVREVIAGLSLDGIAADRVQVRKFPWNANGITEGIFVCAPQPEAVRPSTNCHCDVGYPVQIVAVRASNRDLTANLSRHHLTRQRIRYALDGRPLPGVNEVYMVTVEPGVVYDWASFAANWDCQVLTVRCTAREPLGVQ